MEGLDFHKISKAIEEEKGLERKKKKKAGLKERNDLQ